LLQSHENLFPCPPALSMTDIRGPLGPT